MNVREKKFYTSGEFAKKAGVTIRTIRFYDNKGLLKPSSISQTGYRLYTDEDFAKLQRILTLKYLGFSLEDIFTSMINDSGSEYLKSSLEVQMQIVKKKINHMQLIEKSICEAKKMIEVKADFDWNKIINIIHVLNMEKNLVEQYKDSTNLKVRINLHDRFGVNKQGWFNWILNKINISDNKEILELGCGNGQLWTECEDKVPGDVKIVLSDISEGMLNDARENLKSSKINILFQIIDCNELPYEAESFDIVIANHMLFYIKDREKAFAEIKRILKNGGYFYCSTYGLEHMKEIEELTKNFDSRIVLAEINLPEIFGLENGEEQLTPWFGNIQKHIYDDYLLVNDYKPLLDYILSCHGNEHEILEGRYDEFERYVKSKVQKTGVFKISKQAGLFQCRKLDL
jgi:ubiquinone/menaquinone biosynthesis C-methylase UbiE